MEPTMAEPRRILVIEDDPDIARMLALNLRAEGYAVEVEPSGEAGLARLRRAPCDLLVLDLMLPGIDGLAVCREVRRMVIYLPIIIVSREDYRDASCARPRARRRRLSDQAVLAA